MISIRNVRFLCIALVLAFAIPAYARPTSKQLYQKAVDLQKALKASDQLQQKITEWKKVVDAFRSVYYTYPSSSLSDNALFQVAALYAEMGSRFHDTLYFRRATSSYEFLIEQYKSSSFVSEAMLEYIRIMRDELKDRQSAEEMEVELKKTSPKAAAAANDGPAATRVQPAEMKTLRHYTGTDYSRIVIDFDREVTYKRNRLNDPDRIYIDFENTVAYKSLLRDSIEVEDGFLKKVRVGQYDYRRARVVLDLKSIENYEVFPLYHPYRIVIDIQGKKSATPPSIATLPQTQPVATTPPEMAKTNTDGKYSLARQLGLKVQRIIVDPGHGGQDPGAMYGKMQEKDITLDVSQRLRKILQDQYGYEVLMTRDSDEFIPLEQRTAYANSNSADLFVSVHVNSSRNKKARGIETYYLNFATTPEAMEVAARENAIAEKNMGELQKLTTAIAMNSKIEESRDFANLIQTNLVDQLKRQYQISSLGVKQAPFYVLIGAQMPSILAEISFISNDRESTLLAKPDYRQSIAEGIAKGVKIYTDTLAENKLTQNRN
jgi:N-acetylmuramoyl-L-alanine amidase